MAFPESERERELQARLRAFMEEHVYPHEDAYRDAVASAVDRWETPELMQRLKAKAREAGLWNLFLPPEHRAGGLTNLGYARLAETMGRVIWASEVFNCSAPDTGNMEVLAKYGSDEQKERWLEPLLAGEIRSAFAMTEPAVASSDATNIETSIRREGDEYRIDGRKWFISGAMNRRCKFLVVMGKTDPDSADRHRQQSMMLVPMDTPGVSVLRPMTAFGYDDAPVGHAEIDFENVRVPAENLILGEGRGFEIAQGRLGPGRIHHCMRLIGCAQRALEMTCARAESRSTFGRKLSQHGSVREHIAKAACAIEQARLLTLSAAEQIDQVGAKEARDAIAMIKIAAPAMACEVIDRAIQLHGAAGVSADHFLAEAYGYARWCRIVDGPDEVHLMSLGRQLLKRYGAASQRPESDRPESQRPARKLAADRRHDAGLAVRQARELDVAVAVALELGGELLDPVRAFDDVAQRVEHPDGLRVVLLRPDPELLEPTLQNPTDGRVLRPGEVVHDHLAARLEVLGEARDQNLEVRVLRQVRGDDEIERAAERRLFGRAQDERYVRVGREPLLRDGEVVLGHVDADELDLREASADIGREDPGAASEIEHPPLGGDPRQELFLPLLVHAVRRVIDDGVVVLAGALGKDPVDHSVALGVA